MSDTNQDHTGTISRRSVLRKGTAAGTLIVGGTALSGTALANGGTGWILRGPDDFASWSDVTAFRVTPGTFQSGPRFTLDVRPSCNENQQTKPLTASYGIGMLENRGDCYEQVGTTRLWPYPSSKELEFGEIYKFNNFRPCPARTSRSAPEFDEKTDRVTFAQMKNAEICAENG